MPSIFLVLTGLVGGSGPGAGAAGMGGAFVTVFYWIFVMPCVLIANLVGLTFPVRSSWIAAMRAIAITFVTRSIGWLAILAIIHP